jgi:hypothetical protein
MTNFKIINNNFRTSNINIAAVLLSQSQELIKAERVDNGVEFEFSGPNIQDILHSYFNDTLVVSAMKITSSYLVINTMHDDIVVDS